MLVFANVKIKELIRIIKRRRKSLIKRRRRIKRIIKRRRRVKSLIIVKY